MMTERKPRIAIASYILADPEAGRPEPTYLNAVYLSGGLGFLTGPVLTEEDAEQIFQAFDGLILTGGMDIGAEFLSEPVHPKSVPVPRERDLTEFLLAKRFMAGEKPVLGVCRGEQLLNLVMGGTVDQHIFDRPEVTIAHRDESTRHPAEVIPGTLLASIFPGQKTLTVNSIHHQAVRKLAPGCVLNAMSPDGVIEGYSYGDRVLGVQFHPEKMVDEGMKPIFDWFVGKCRESAGNT